LTFDAPLKPSPLIRPEDEATQVFTFLFSNRIGDESFENASRFALQIAEHGTSDHFVGPAPTREHEAQENIKKNRGAPDSAAPRLRAREAVSLRHASLNKKDIAPVTAEAGQDDAAALPPASVMLDPTISGRWPREHHPLLSPMLAPRHTKRPSGK